MSARLLVMDGVVLFFQKSLGETKFILEKHICFVVAQ